MFNKNLKKMNIYIGIVSTLNINICMRLNEFFRRSLFTQLALNKGIGWDVDETLIDNPNSKRIQKFIKSHPEINHCIVTYRTHNLVSTIFSDIAEYNVGLTQQNFSAVYTVNQKLWIEFDNIQYQRELKKIQGPPTAIELEFFDWKALICKEHNLTALVDDRIEWLMYPCQKYGIKLFDSYSFI